MQTTVYPILYNETLTESALEKGECSNGIYVPGTLFRNFYSEVGATDSELVILKLSRGERTLYAHITSMHHGEEGISYIPTWMFYHLGCDIDNSVIEFERAHPSIGTTITIKPHTSGYADGADPVTALQHAFESYSCLTPDSSVPLFVEGERVYVTIMETNRGQPICIRGVELGVVIDTPLDVVEEEEEEKRPDTPIPPELPPLFEPAAVDTRFPGSGYRLGSA
jgi:hypothetical protein